MNREVVDRIAQATLYEGYILYPYSATALKNQVRWTFGGVHPRAYSEASGGGTDRWTVQTECLLAGGDDATVGVIVRFLHPVVRTACAPADPQGEGEGEGADVVPGFRAVDKLRIGDALHRTWEEAVQRDVELAPRSLGALLAEPAHGDIAVADGRAVEELVDADGTVAGALVRDHEALRGDIEVRAERVSPEVARVTVVIRNLTDVEPGGELERQRAMRRAMVSTHAILEVEGGRWLSLADPPEELAETAAGCRNEGLWPVLVGDADDTVLASPIILDDHPQVAPESPGDMFDSREIDELLSLSILSLTDDEKAEMRASDPRGRAMLERTEALSNEAMLRLHGVIRELRPLGEDES